MKISIHIVRVMLCTFTLVSPLWAAPVAQADILKTSDRLQSEERRQHTVRRQVSGIVQYINWLVRDLDSNGLFGEAGGAKIQKVNKLLESVGEVRVDGTAEFLLKARTELNAALKNISGADTEIEFILEELTTVLAGTGAILLDDKLIKELELLIQQEEFLRRQTAVWGKKIITAPTAAKADKGRLSRAQQVMGEQYNTFLSLLEEMRKGAFDEDVKRRFSLVQKTLSDASVGASIGKAVEQVKAANVIAAVGSQDEVIVALKAALTILTSEEMELEAFIKMLEQIIADEKALKKKVGEEKAFASKKSGYEATQIQIGLELRKLGEAMPDMFENEWGGSFLKPATDEVNKAVRLLYTGEQKPAIVAQTEVIRLLEELLTLAMEELEEFNDAGVDELAEASEYIGDGREWDDVDIEFPDYSGDFDFDFQEIDDGSPIVGLPAPFTGLGAPKPSSKISKAQGDPPPFMVPGVNGGTEIGGKKVKAERLAGSTLRGQNKNKAAIQTYVQQLPPEFRRQVADYYEVLAQ